MNDKPRVRPVEAFPVQQDGKTSVYLKDPLNFATPLGISPAGYFVLAHFDGQHSFTDVQEAYCKQFGSLLMSDDLKSFVDMLDQHYYVDSERFRDSKTRWYWNFVTKRRACRRMSVAFTKPIPK